LGPNSGPPRTGRNHRPRSGPPPSSAFFSLKKRNSLNRGPPLEGRSCGPNGQVARWPIIWGGRVNQAIRPSKSNLRPPWAWLRRLLRRPRPAGAPALRGPAGPPQDGPHPRQGAPRTPALGRGHCGPQAPILRVNTTGPFENLPEAAALPNGYKSKVARSRKLAGLGGGRRLGWHSRGAESPSIDQTPPSIDLPMRRFSLPGVRSAAGLCVRGREQRPLHGHRARQRPAPRPHGAPGTARSV